MKPLLIALLTIVLSISCVPHRYLNKHHDEICLKCIDEFTADFQNTTTVITHHDTTYIDVSENLHDTTYIQLKCDSLGNVLIVTVKKLKDSQKIISSYIMKNNVLNVVNERLNDSIMILSDSIVILNNKLQIIEKPVVTIYKVPLWVYWVGGIISLFLIILLISVFKK